MDDTSIKHLEAEFLVRLKKDSININSYNNGKRYYMDVDLMYINIAFDNNEVKDGLTTFINERCIGCYKIFSNYEYNLLTDSANQAAIIIKDSNDNIILNVHAFYGSFHYLYGHCVEIPENTDTKILLEPDCYFLYGIQYDQETYNSLIIKEKFKLL